MKNIKVKNHYDKYDWPVFASSYLLTARLVCQELLDNRENKHNSSTHASFYLPYRPGHLFVAILFNVKHGIEVFIKALSIFAYGEYEEGHNIEDLFQKVKIEVANLKLIPIKNGGNEVRQNDINSLSEDLNNAGRLISYFYGLDMLKPKIGSHYTISDIQNDICRYPDNKASIRLDWDSILDSQISEGDIKEVKEKLDQIHDLFNKIGYLFSVSDYERSKS